MRFNLALSVMLLSSAIISVLAIIGLCELVGAIGWWRVVESLGLASALWISLSLLCMRASSAGRRAKC